MALLFGLGAWALVTQTIFAREFLVVFLGNELCLGMIFASWLLGISMGASLGGFLSRRPLRSTLLVGCVVLMWALFPLQVLLIGVLRRVLGVGPGELVPFLSLAVGTFALISPFSLLVGLAFPLACAELTRANDDGATGIGAVYVAEALGSLAGGVLFTFVLVGRLSPFRIAALISLVAIGAGALVVRGSRRRSRWLSVLLGAVSVGSLLLLVTPVGDLVNRTAVLGRWRSLNPGIPLLQTPEGKDLSIESKYQNLALARQREQYTLFANGKPTASFPDEPAFQEQAHFLMVQHPRPRNVLLIGGGIEGLTRQILKHGVERLDYVMLDPQELALMQEYLPEVDRGLLDDPRVSIFHEDGRHFVKRTSTHYDMVILNLPDPETALLNRFYTLDFFREVRAILEEEGVLVLGISSVLGPLGYEVGPMAGSIYWSLREVYEDVFATPGTHIYYFASPREGVIERHPSQLASRFLKRNITPTSYQFIYAYLLQTDLVERRQQDLLATRGVSFNTDFKPLTYFYSLILWDRYSGSQFAPIFHRLKQLNFSWLTLPVAGILLVLVVLQLLTPSRRRAHRRLNLCLSIASTGFAAMAAELVLLFAFQNLYGYVYQKIGLIVAIFMLGLAVGGWLMMQRSRRRVGTRLWELMLVDLAIGGFMLALPVGIKGCAAARMSLALLEPVFMSLVLVGGFLTGCAFPLAARLHLEPAGEVGRTAGAIDASDHIGACLGALVTGVILVPVLGIVGTCAFAAILKAASLILLALSATGVLSCRKHV